MLTIPKTIMRPARYTGIEPLRITKDPRDVKVRFALCYPDIYEIGMSYYGLFLLYEISNNVDGIACERCFAPWSDMEAYLRETGNNLTTLESKTPLHAMDLIGFSLTYELNVTNILNMLSLGGVPIRAEERTEKDPLVIGGGPLMLNPAPYESFFDILVVGEADEAIVSILTTFREMKGGRRQDIIAQLAMIDGVYSRFAGPKRPKRLFVKDLDAAYHPVRPPIPTVDSVHNRLNIEISRGCGNGCRFCLAGFGYRPYRERSFDAVRAIIDEGLHNTGYEEISLLSLSSGDYRSLFDVLDYAKRQYNGLSVSLPSLKIGSIGKEEIAAMGEMARTGFTFALEAPTAGLRSRLNKDIDIDNLVMHIPQLKDLGWRRLKLYLMIGFPWETEDDLRAIYDVVTPFRKAGMDINLSISPFTPKPHTPFQWLGMDDEDVLMGKILLIKDILKKTGTRVRYRDTSVSMVEGIIARADERLTPLFEHLHDEGVRLEAWREHFSIEPYRRWFSDAGIDMKDYTGPRHNSEKLSWDVVNMGFDRSFLLTELEKAHSGEMTGDCLTGCAGCGLMCGIEDNAGGTRVSENPPFSSPPAPAIISGPQAQPKKITFRYGKYGDARYIGHLDTMSILVRAMKASGLTIRMRGKYHPLPKIVLTDALPVGIESFYEFIEIETDHDVKIDDRSITTINQRLASGIKIYDFIEGSLSNVVKDYLFVAVTDAPQETEMPLWKHTGEKYFYLWHGKSAKQLWNEGIFSRIIKIGSGRLHHGI